MEELKSYLLRLTGAAMLCGAAMSFLGKQTASGKLVKVLISAFMALTLLQPLSQIRIGNLTDRIHHFQEEGEQVAAVGTDKAAGAWVEGIKTAAESYILDKAKRYGAELQVEIFVSAGAVPSLSAVRISGQISPYGKNMLTELIQNDLGIAEEDQIWIG